MRWLVFALVALLLSACSTGATSSSGNGEPIPRRDANDLATVRAMAGLDSATPTPRTAVPTATATAPLAAVATATPEPPSRNSGLVSDAIYYDTLLVPQDIANNWTLGGFDGIQDAAFCDAASIEDTFTTLGWAYGSYSASGGQWAEQWVARLTEPDAQAAMEYARTTFACDQFSKTAPNGDVSYWAFSPASSPPVGDDAYAITVNITWQNPVYTPLVGSIVFIRKGEYVVALWHYGFTIDPIASARMVEVAVARLDLVADSSV